MTDFSLVPVDHQPDFGDVSLVPVDHDPFSDDGVIQQAQGQPAQPPPVPPPPVQTQPQPASPLQPLATGTSQPVVGAPANGGEADGESWDPNSASGQPYHLSAAQQTRCGENPGHCSVGQAIGAVGDGAYSSLEGVGNALRFVGRSIGLYGPDEIKRSDQEIRAVTAGVEDGGKLLIDSPEARSIAIRAAKEAAAAAAAHLQDERNAYFLLGRVGFGTITGLGPVAAIGDSTRALENGHNTIDALGKGIIGNR